MSHVTVCVQIQGSIPEALKKLREAQDELLCTPGSDPDRAQEINSEVVRNLIRAPSTVTTPNVVVLAELIHAVRADSKIQAIKAIRSLTNLGLRESKDLVDSVWLRAPETY